MMHVGWRDPDSCPAPTVLVVNKGSKGGPGPAGRAHGFGGGGWSATSRSNLRCAIARRSERSAVRSVARWPATRSRAIEKDLANLAGTNGHRSPGKSCSTSMHGVAAAADISRTHSTNSRGGACAICAGRCGPGPKTCTMRATRFTRRACRVKHAADIVADHKKVEFVAHSLARRARRRRPVGAVTGDSYHPQGPSIPLYHVGQHGQVLAT